MTATDGPGDFNFVQGTNNSHTNAYWNYIASYSLSTFSFVRHLTKRALHFFFSFLCRFLSDPTPEQIKCQYPKPILLNVGGINLPSPWEPSILPLQMFRVGQLVLIGVPGEFSTMAGRRLRDTVSSVLLENGLDATVVIAGLTNAYSHYITTKEEYGLYTFVVPSATQVALPTKQSGSKV